uniref:Uncharacterized protein n=1 Tax=Setaria italica TaxID=4555 RepID=K3ZBG6_SETIT
MNHIVNKVDLDTHSAKNEARKYRHQMQSLRHQSRAIGKLGSCNRYIFQTCSNVKYDGLHSSQLGRVFYLYKY